MGYLSAIFSTWIPPLQQALLGRWQRHERRFDHGTWRLMVLAWVGCLGMPLFYVIWTEWFPQPYESLLLRMIGTALCLPALWPGRLLQWRWLEPYLFVAVTYVLPFQFTFLYLMNHASSVWSQSLLIALIVLFHFPTRWALASCALGSTLAYAMFALLADPIAPLDAVMLENLPIFAFTIIVVSVAKVGRRVLANEKLAGMAQGLATVSHELRTPLASVDANVRGMMRRLQRPDADAAGAADADADSNAMSEALARIQHEVRHMNHMIDLFLLSASAANGQLAAIETVSMQEVVEAMIRRYPFAAQSQRDAVRVEIRADFTFSGSFDLSIVILLNLLRNALNALHRAGKGRIRIVIDGRRAAPRLLFIDTGCGIDPARLPLIFKRFYSYPPSSGSGIGLALCKEIVEAWQARIRCVSRQLAYTMFVLEFPRLPSAAPH